MLMEIIWGVVLIIVLVLSSGVAVEVFERLASHIKIKKIVLATLLVSFSTSLPELSIGLASALKGQPQIALGDVLGANLANLSWIVGGAAIVAGSIPVVGEYLKKDLWAAIVLSMLPFVLMTDGDLSRLDGTLLVVCYFVYAIWTMEGNRAKQMHEKINKQHVVHHHFKTVHDWIKNTVILLVSLAVMAISAGWLINLAIEVSSGLGVNSFWVGLLIISFGTTLPELVLSLAASARKDIALLLGNVLGSVVLNSTFILGIIAIISPVVFESSVEKGLAGIFLVIVLGLFWIFTKSKRKLERWEGLVLIGIYFMFIGMQFLFA